MLAVERPAEARDLLREQLAEVQQRQSELTPLDGTQLYQSLSLACEATQEWRPAMEALRQSKGYCAQWVGTSMNSRLAALRLEASAPEEGQAQAQTQMARRMQAIDELVSRTISEARQSSAVSLTLRQNEPVAPAPPHASGQVAYVADEMRKPVSGLIGVTSLLMMSQLDTKQRRWVELMQSSSQLLLQLCNDLLDMATIEAGKFALNPEPTDVQRLLEDAVATMQPLADAKSLALQVQLDGAIPPLQIDS